MYTEKKAVIVCRCSHLTIQIVKPHLTANCTTQVFYRKLWDVGRTLQKFENHEPDSETFLIFSQHPVWGFTPVNR